MVIPAQDRKHRINTANNLKKVNDTYIAIYSGFVANGFQRVLCSLVCKLAHGYS